MKKIFIFLAAIVAAMSVNAVEVPLWSGTATESGVELNATQVAAFEAGDVLRVYATVPEGGANFKICYKYQDGEKWPECTIPSLKTQWPWMNGGETYYDVNLKGTDLTAIAEHNSSIYIYNGEHSTITKVSIIREDLAPGVEKTLWTGTETLSWNHVAPQSAITAALLGEKDQLIVSVSAKSTTEQWPKVCLEDNNTDIIAGADIPLWGVTEFPYDGALTLTAAHVAALQGGFTLGGIGVTITKLVLKKYKNGGGATAVENTAAQVKGVKVLRDGIMYIQRGENLYNMQGQIVK